LGTVPGKIDFETLVVKNILDDLPDIGLVIHHQNSCCCHSPDPVLLYRCNRITDSPNHSVNSSHPAPGSPARSAHGQADADACATLHRIVREHSATVTFDDATYDRQPKLCAAASGADIRFEQPLHHRIGKTRAVITY